MGADAGQPRQNLPPRSGHRLGRLRSRLHAPPHCTPNLSLPTPTLLDRKCRPTTAEVTGVGTTRELVLSTKLAAQADFELRRTIGQRGCRRFSVTPCYRRTAQHRKRLRPVPYPATFIGPRLRGVHRPRVSTPWLYLFSWDRSSCR